jgi:hypothetical protein
LFPPAEKMVNYSEIRKGLHFLFTFCYTSKNVPNTRECAFKQASVCLLSKNCQKGKWKE